MTMWNTSQLGTISKDTAPNGAMPNALKKLIYDSKAVEAAKSKAAAPKPTTTVVQDVENQTQGMQQEQQAKQLALTVPPQVLQEAAQMQMQMQAPQGAPGPTAPQGIASLPPQGMPPEGMPQGMPPQQTASIDQGVGGLPDTGIDQTSFAGGGIVAFSGATDDRSLVKGGENNPVEYPNPGANVTPNYIEEFLSRAAGMTEEEKQAYRKNDAFLRRVEPTAARPVKAEERAALNKDYPMPSLDAQAPEQLTDQAPITDQTSRSTYEQLSDKGLPDDLANMTPADNVPTSGLPGIAGLPTPTPTPVAEPTPVVAAPQARNVSAELPPGGIAEVVPTPKTLPAAGIKLLPGAGAGSAIARTMGIEGGMVKDDAGKGVTNFGINQTANPDVDVKNLTKEKAEEIYRTRYWDTIPGIDNLSPDAQKIVFDAAVNQGVPFAKKILAENGDNPTALIAARKAKYAGVIAAEEQRKGVDEPNKYKQYAKGWDERVTKGLAILNPDQQKTFDKVSQEIDRTAQANIKKRLDHGEGNASPLPDEIASVTKDETDKAEKQKQSTKFALAGATPAKATAAAAAQKKDEAQKTGIALLAPTTAKPSEEMNYPAYAPLVDYATRVKNLQGIMGDNEGKNISDEYVKNLEGQSARLKKNQLADMAIGLGKGLMDRGGPGNPAGRASFLTALTAGAEGAIGSMQATQKAQNELAKEIFGAKNSFNTANRAEKSGMLKLAGEIAHNEQAFNASLVHYKNADVTGKRAIIAQAKGLLSEMLKASEKVLESPLLTETERANAQKQVQGILEQMTAFIRHDAEVQGVSMPTQTTSTNTASTTTNNAARAILNKG